MWSSHIIQKTNIQKTQFKIIKNLPGPTLYSVFILTAQKFARRKITILLFSLRNVQEQGGWHMLFHLFCLQTSYFLFSTTRYVKYISYLSLYLLCQPECLVK